MRIRIIALGAVLLALVSCHKTPQPHELPPQNLFLGTVSVDYEGGVVDNPGIRVACLPSPDWKQADIIIYKIKFVPKMPVRIDVTIPAVKASQKDDEVLMSCNNVIPLALGGEYPKYNVTDFRGSLKGDVLSFSLNFGEYPTRFTGTRITESAPQ